MVGSQPPLVMMKIGAVARKDALDFKGAVLLLHRHVFRDRCGTQAVQRPNVSKSEHAQPIRGEAGSAAPNDSP